MLTSKQQQEARTNLRSQCKGFQPKGYKKNFFEILGKVYGEHKLYLQRRQNNCYKSP